MKVLVPNLVFALLFVSSLASAGTVQIGSGGDNSQKKLASIKQISEIVCTVTKSYLTEYPQTTLPARGVFIFKPGTLADLKSKAGAFLLNSYDYPSDTSSVMEKAANQQFYFAEIENQKINFSFIAGWKAGGHLDLNYDGSVTGSIFQKNQTSELSCNISLK